MHGFRYLNNVTTLAFDAEACNGCGVCVEVCPHNVFALGDCVVSVVDRDGCIECGACALNCELGAIKVDAGVGCAVGLYTEWWRERTHRRAPRPTCC
jgi:NAD-dependent dihydropyrimidine dehydrogenase PreA subunit